MLHRSYCAPRCGHFNEAPAENGGRLKTWFGWWRGFCYFNEAPAENGGRFPAQEPTVQASGHFNEAPAENGGRSDCRWGMRAKTCHFNEAPAENGGRSRIELIDCLSDRQTSMRPPQKTGEDVLNERASYHPHATTSMRPPQKTGEDTGLGRLLRDAYGTSMRPPQKTGEDTSRLRSRTSSCALQ